jgi:hypothetical protein
MPVRPARIIIASAIAVLSASAIVAILANSEPLAGQAADAASTPRSTVSDTSVETGTRPGNPTSSDATNNSGTSDSGPSSSSGTSAATPAPVASSTATSASTPQTTSGIEKVWVSVLSTTPQASDDVNTGMTQSAVQTLINQMNTYWSAQSNGDVTIQLAGFETRSLGESSCDPNAALSAEEKSAFGGMFANDAWKGTHEHLLVLSTESCSAESFATVGGVGGEIFSGNGIGASMGEEYLLHEFGHNLGFEHADASICTNTSSFDGRTADFSFTSTVCPTREYDDYFDIMGYTVKNATPNLSSPQRILSGWMTNYATLTSSTPSSTTRLTALGGSGGTQALVIVDPASGDTYYVEYRADSGLDATSAEFNFGLQCDPAMSGYTICELDSNKNTGVVRILRVLPFPSSGANGTTVMATALTAGSTDKTKRHTHLDAGNSFTAVDGGFTLTVVSTSPSAGASVSVSFASGSSTPTSNPTPQFSTAPTTAQYPVTGTNNASAGVMPQLTRGTREARAL